MCCPVAWQRPWACNALPSAVPTQTGQPANVAVAVGAPINEPAASTPGPQGPAASKDPNETKQSAASGPRGLGRSAKNLSALLQRAESTQKDGSEAAAEDSNKGGDGKSGSNPERGQANSSNATQSADQAGPPSQSPMDTAEASNEGEDGDDAPVRRGKGFGIKNLAAMRARATKKPE